MRVNRQLFVALALAPAICQAEFWSGNYLLSQINGSPSDRLAAIGYVTGAADAITRVHTCPPAGVTAGQIFDMTKMLLEAMPEHRHQSADAFVRTAMETRWPCKQQQSKDRGT